MNVLTMVTLMLRAASIRPISSSYPSVVAAGTSSSVLPASSSSVMPSSARSIFA
jgi:hypothetical protein